MPMMERERRPAPPPGVEVLTVPEAVVLAEERAKQRGDRRALLMQQDIRKDIAAGRFAIGQDAFWVHIQAHPKGGYWVVTLAAVESRIQERLRGRGRPRKVQIPASVAYVQMQLLPDVHGSDLVAAEAPVGLQGISPAQAGEHTGYQVSGDVQSAVTARVAEFGGVVEFVATVLGNRGYEPFPVADPAQYRQALAEAIKLHGDQRGRFELCRCGWAGQADAMRWLPYPDGIGKHASCPACGRPRSREEIAYVSAVVLELPWVREEVEEAVELTRNEKWATKMRKHLRHLELMRRQASLDELVIPGVIAQVTELTERVQRLLEEDIVLPVAMRTAPTRQELDVLARRFVQPALEHLDRFSFEGAVAAELLEVVKMEGAQGFARAILDRVIAYEDVWATLRWLAKQGVGGQELERSARLLELLSKLPASEFQEARIVYRLVVGRGQDFYLAGEAWAKEEYGANRQRWRAYRSAAELFYQLLTAIEHLLMQEARAQVQIKVDAEVERLAALAVTEAARTGKRPLQIVAAWVRSRRRTQFASPEMARLVAYPLAQRLLDGKGSGESLLSKEDAE